MADYSGLLTGLQSAIGSYYDATKAREDREERKRMQELEFRAKGLLPEYDDSGKLVNLGEDPAVKQRQMQEEISKAALEGKIVEPDEGGLLRFKGYAPEYIEGQKEIYGAKQDPMAKAIQGLQYTKAQRESEQAQKGMKLAPDKVLSVQQGAQIPQQLKDIEKTIEVNKGIFGPIQGMISSSNPYDKTAQTVDAQMRASAQSFGRYMEGGVLRKEDEEKYRKMFPSLSDTPAVAKNKLDIVNKLLVDKQNADVKALKTQGYDVSGFGLLDNAKLPDVLTGAGKKSLSPQDQKAFDWAQQNPSDPRSKAILQKLGM